MDVEFWKKKAERHYFADNPVQYSAVLETLDYVEKLLLAIEQFEVPLDTTVLRLATLYGSVNQTKIEDDLFSEGKRHLLGPILKAIKSANAKDFPEDIVERVLFLARKHRDISVDELI